MGMAEPEYTTEAVKYSMNRHQRRAQVSLQKRARKALLLDIVDQKAKLDSIVRMANVGTEFGPGSPG